jgi:hypothetical protein
MTPLVRFAAALALFACAAPSQTRWHLEPDGGIAWDVPRRAAHQDQIEMSGLRISAIVTYGVREDGTLTLTRQLVFPGLRTIPNDTHASLREPGPRAPGARG